MAIDNDEQYDALRSAILSEGRVSDVLCQAHRDEEHHTDYFEVTVVFKDGEPFPSFSEKSLGHPYPALRELADTYREWIEKPSSP